jgi:hypothetical protein
MLQVEEQTRLIAGIPFIHQHRTLSQQVAMALKDQIERGVKQRVTRADKRRRRLSLWRNQGFLEDNALITRLYRLADTNQTISMAYRRRHVRNFVAPWLALADVPTKLLEGLKKERLDVVRLQTASFGPLHLLPNAMDATHVHRVMGKGAFFEEVLKPTAVKGAFDDLREPCPHLRELAIAHGLDEELAQRAPTEDEFAEDIKYRWCPSIAYMNMNELTGCEFRTLAYAIVVFNWLRVLDTTERSQINQRICHQFHAIVPLLDAFKTQ